uniref:F-box domain-containing protein n=1 Tax=Fagus sylvatica TaxID=28930 RepID=A0A2N9J669_FAGSY
MGPTPNPLNDRSQSKKRKTTILSLEHDILCMIFTLLDFFDLVRCSAVCKYWVDQCRMKMGLILTGRGDKVMRLWSLESYKCREEYSVPDTVPLVDFDFDESKIVGLVGTRICIWRRNGKRSIFPSNEGTFVKGLCMRYYDPEAVVGCEDGTARLFDMYSRKCSRIIRMRAGPVTCLCLSDDQLILSGSSFGSITVSGVLSDQRVATLRSRITTGGIRTLCYNACSRLVFAGSTSGYTSCWDLRTMRSLWETRVSPNVVYSLQHQRNDKSTLVVGGIDGVLRILDQNTGQVLTSCVMEGNVLSSSQNKYGAAERKKGRRLSEDTHIDSIPKSARPPITCLAVGMKKVVTLHNGRYIRLWKFNS